MKKHQLEPAEVRYWSEHLLFATTCILKELSYGLLYRHLTAPGLVMIFRLIQEKHQNSNEP